MYDTKVAPFFFGIHRYDIQTQDKSLIESEF